MTVPPPADPELLAEGRKLARVNLWRLFAISAVVTWTAEQQEPGAAGWLRLLVIGLCCVLAYRGLRWALWVLGLFCALAGVLLFVLAFVQPDTPWTGRVLLGGLGVVQVSAFLILLRAPEVRAFMAAQREATRRSRGG